MNSAEFANAKKSLMLLLPLFLIACGQEEVASPENPTPADIYLSDPLAIERGRAIYEGSCASFCHAVEPDDLAVNLFDCEWHHGSSAEELFDIITRGIADTRMVGFGENFPEGLDDTWRVVAYLLSNQSNCGLEEEAESSAELQ